MPDTAPGPQVARGGRHRPPGLPRLPARLRPPGRRRLWAAVAVLLLLGASGLGLWRQQRQRSRQLTLDTYTQVARLGTLPGVVTASGELNAIRRVNVSPERQGLLAELYVDEGDRVRSGQAIALMDSGDLTDRLEEQQAQLQLAQARLAGSRSKLLNNRELLRRGVISASGLDEYQSAYDADRMAVAAARNRLEQLQEEQRELTIRAPFDGVITARFADPGAYVTPTTTASSTAGASSSSVVELAQGLEAVAKVPESDVGRLRVGQQASVRLDAFPDRRFAARIRQIAPRAIKTNNVTSFEVKLQLLEPSAELRIGMTADIDFQTGELPQATLVPTVAIVTENGRPGVLVPGPDNQPRFQPVQLGASSGRDTQILSGLRSGERVFVDLPPGSRRPGN